MTISLFAPRELRGLSPPIRALVRAALAAEGLGAGEIAVMLTGDADLRALNREWRCIDRATDVLSFSYDETGPGETVRPATRVPSRRPRPAGAGIPEGSPAPKRRGARPRTHGDLVIPLDRARDQARRFRVSEGAELARLVIHGALHLAGLDHRRPVERRRMRVCEDAVLRSQRVSVRALEHVLRRDTGGAKTHAGAARRRG